MARDGRVLAIEGLDAGLVGPDARFRLAMGRHDGRGRGEQRLQGLLVVDQHVARRRAHEKLDAADTAVVGLRYFLEIVVGGSQPESIVGPRLGTGQVHLVLPGGQRHRGRVGVGHVEKGGHASRHRRHRLGGDVGLVRQPRLAEMHMGVDHPGQQPQPPGLDALHSGPQTAQFIGQEGRKGRALGINAGHKAVFNQDRTLHLPAFVDYRCITDQGSRHGLSF